MYARLFCCPRKEPLLTDPVLESAKNILNKLNAAVNHALQQNTTPASRILKTTFNAGMLTAALVSTGYVIYYLNQSENDEQSIHPQLENVASFYNQAKINCPELFIYRNNVCYFADSRLIPSEFLPCELYDKRALQCETWGGFGSIKFSDFLYEDLNQCAPELMSNYTAICDTVNAVRHRYLAPFVGSLTAALVSSMSFACSLICANKSRENMLKRSFSSFPTITVDEENTDFLAKFNEFKQNNQLTMGEMIEKVEQFISEAQQQNSARSDVSFRRAR